MRLGWDAACHYSMWEKRGSASKIDWIGRHVIYRGKILLQRPGMADTASSDLGGVPTGSVSILKNYEPHSGITLRLYRCAR